MTTVREYKKWEEVMGYTPCFKTWGPSLTVEPRCIRPRLHEGLCFTALGKQKDLRRWADGKKEELLVDQDSADIFGTVFRHFAEKPDARGMRFGMEVWMMMKEGKVYFSPNQMNADEALIKLGLAVKREGYRIQYAGDEPERE